MAITMRAAMFVIPVASTAAIPAMAATNTRRRIFATNTWKKAFKITPNVYVAIKAATTKNTAVNIGDAGEEARMIDPCLILLLSLN